MDVVTVAVRVWNSVVSASKPSAVTATVELNLHCRVGGEQWAVEKTMM